MCNRYTKEMYKHVKIYIEDYNWVEFYVCIYEGTVKIFFKKLQIYI